MKNMSCYSCALKHIAAAISYAKEVSVAHGVGSELDHRADLLGEIISAEHHLQALESDLARQLVNGIRKKLESARYVSTEQDINSLRRAWSVIEKEFYLQNKPIEEQKTVVELTPKKPCGCGGKSPSVARAG